MTGAFAGSCSAQILSRAVAKAVSIAVAVLLLLGMSVSSAGLRAETSGTIDRAVLALAEEAKAKFRRRMTPPAPFLALIQVVEREETQAVRGYAVRAFEDGLDALAAEADRSEEAKNAVKVAIRKFVRTGKADLTETIFAGIIERSMAHGDARLAAAAIRHSVALVELPAALAQMIKLPGEALPFAPLGNKALPAYRRAANLDPNDPWTWIAIAWMGQAAGAPASEVEAAIDSAERAAVSAGDLEATIVAFQALGHLRVSQDRSEDALQALREAVRLSEVKAKGGSDALADLALALTLLGDLDRRRGDATAAAGAHGRAFDLRQRLAAAFPNDRQAQLNVAVSHLHLAFLASQAGRTDEKRRHWERAHAIYHVVASHDRFLPTLDPAQAGAAMQVFLFAGVLTLVGGIVLLYRYRHAVDRLMKAAASARRAVAAPDAGAPVVHSDTTSTVATRFLDVSKSRGQLREVFSGLATPRSAPIASAQGALRRGALLQVLAGATFATVATALTFTSSNVGGYDPMRALVIFWSWAWGVVVVLMLLWGGDRTRLAVVLGLYVGGLLLMCGVVAAGDTPPLQLYGMTVPSFFQPLIFWAFTVFDSLFLLFFLNRRVRSVGPVLLVLAVIVCWGGELGLVVMSMYVVTHAFSVAGDTLGLSVPIIFLLVVLLGMIVLALPAWWLIGRIRRAYQAKWISDQILMFDAIWLFQALILCMNLIHNAGLSGWIGLTAFAGYKLVATAGARPLARSAARRPAAKLLLLRVFGFRGRAERLFDVLEARWRFAGPIQMIAAPDLAGRTIDPGEIIDFLSGRLRRRFIIEPGDLQRRLAEIDLRPDPDGRFRVNDIFCGNDTWRAAVQSLMAESDLVAMDLRGFSPQNKGCVYELQVLLDTVPASRIVVLADRSTDLPFLDRTLADCARTMVATSPNQSSRDPLTVLNVGSDDRSAVRALLSIADTALLNSRDLTPSGELVPDRGVRPQIA